MIIFTACYSYTTPVDRPSIVVDLRIVTNKLALPQVPGVPVSYVYTKLPAIPVMNNQWYVVNGCNFRFQLCSVILHRYPSHKPLVAIHGAATGQAASYFEKLTAWKRYTHAMQTHGSQSWTVG